MAQRVTIEMMDDLDGSQADETVRFAVDGNAYEIDLSQKNAAEIRRTFDRYIEHARKAARGARQARASRNRRHSSDVRAWAKSRGIQINERGRIPASIVAEYEAANA
ncbi:MAG TPA: Lsr2 family protein [Candidatus Binatia bacterium]|nr:Lsr2 family protein [Candidatus Binatia bacterium]